MDGYLELDESLGKVHIDRGLDVFATSDASGLRLADVDFLEGFHLGAIAACSPRHVSVESP